MADVASKDENSVSTLLAVSSDDGSSPIKLYADPSSHRLLVSGGGGGGGVNSVAVATANGFAGTVASPTTNPVITVKTTVTGVLKGNGTSISAAVGDTDYQNPITLTTTGSSGPATFISDVLNIPQYSGGGSTPNLSQVLTVGNDGGNLGMTNVGLITDISAVDDIDLTNRILYDSSGLASFNYNHRNIIATDGSTIIVDGTNLFLTNTFGIDVLRWDSQTLYDASNHKSGDWTNRTLYKTGGSAIAFDYTGTGNNSALLSFNGSGVIRDASGNTYLTAATLPAGPWSLSTGVVSLTTGTNHVYIQTGIYDVSTNLSVDSSNRQLIASDGTTVLLDWSSAFSPYGAYALPSTDGTAGQTMVTDGAGSVTWQTAGATIASRYVLTFNATTDWGSPSGGFYTISLSGATHGHGNNPMTQFFEDTGGGALVTVQPDQVTVDNTNGNITFRVTSTPDLRFAGQCVVI